MSPTTLIIAAVAFVIGGFVGYFLLRSGLIGQARIKELEEALAAKDKELTTYKKQVVDEFTLTADKFRNLNRSYEELHRQLARSATNLCGDAGTPLLLDSTVTNRVAADLGEASTAAEVDGTDAEEPPTEEFEDQAFAEEEFADEEFSEEDASAEAVEDEDDREDYADADDLDPEDAEAREAREAREDSPSQFDPSWARKQD